MCDKTEVLFRAAGSGARYLRWQLSEAVQHVRVDINGIYACTLESITQKTLINFICGPKFYPGPGHGHRVEVYSPLRYKYIYV